MALDARAGMAQRPTSRTRTRVRVVREGDERARSDYLATEEPLEIRLVARGQTHKLAITMRTPGADFELAAGFLYGEGVIGGRDDISRITYCTDPDIDSEQRFNIVNVELGSRAAPDLRSLERHFYTTSACGVCGKASLEALQIRDCGFEGPGGGAAGHLSSARQAAGGPGCLRVDRLAARCRPLQLLSLIHI